MIEDDEGHARLVNYEDNAIRQLGLFFNVIQVPDTI
jgi:hypothetical protein